MTSLVVAYAKNRVIGRNNELPWYISEDLKHFKELTTSKTVIMGRNTYESIVKRLGRPLPNRRNIVVSSTLKESKGIEVAPSLEAAISLAENDKETILIGGQQLYEEALRKDLVERIYATEIDADINGDRYFPKLDPAHWKVVATENHENSDYKYKFVIYERTA